MTTEALTIIFDVAAQDAPGLFEEAHRILKALNVATVLSIDIQAQPELVASGRVTRCTGTVTAYATIAPPEVTS